MKRRITVIIALAAVCCLLFAACSSGMSGADSHESYPSYGSNSKESFYNAAPGDPEDAPSADIQMPLNRKVIRNAELRVETLEFDSMLTAMRNKVAELGGYVQSDSVSGRSYGNTGLRSAHTVVRVPAERLDEFLTAVDGLGNVISREEGVDDVTDTYVDTEARLSSLRTEYQTLLDLLAKAEDLEDIITLQDRLSEVRYNIESYEAKLRSYDSLIAYSTVTLTINEVERETAIVEESFGDEVSRRFSESLEDVGDGFKACAAWFIGNLPTILVLLILFVGLPLLIIFICVRSARKRREKRRAAKEKAMAEAKAGETNEV